MENPFADYGRIIKGERFIGRKREIKAIQNRIFGSSYGNLAIQGLPRIGKSSLAWNAIIEKKEDLEKRSIIPIRINAGSINDAKEFILKLVKELHQAVIRLKPKSLQYFQEIYDSINNSVKINDRNDFVEKYYTFLRKTNMRVIYILDEFDAVREYFEVVDFQFLRELSYNPDTEICIVTTSRRSLKEIEPHEGSLSNFYQTFTDLNLSMYSEEDMIEYWDKFFNSRIPISAEGKRTIQAFAGNHPFLLDLFNYSLYNNLSNNIIDSIEKTRNEIKLSILKNYSTILNLLKDEKLDSKLMQAVVGPIYDITVSDAEKLERYGLIKKSTTKTININNNQLPIYETFSEDFDNYLNMTRRETPIWNLWSETETKLRSIVYKWLIGKFGDNWVAKFRKLQNKEDFIAKLELSREKEKKSFPETYSTNLLDFTYPADLFDKFMRVEWQWFKQIFGKEANEWKAKFDLLAKIRNPLAHNKENILKEYEKDNATGYCKEIVSLIDKWEKQYINTL